MDPYALTWALTLVAAAALWPVVAIRGEMPPFGPLALGILAGSAVLNIVRKILIVKGLESTDLSLAGPLMGTTPMFLLVISPVVLGEVPSWSGGLGVLVTVVGSYVLCVGTGSDGLVRPVRALLSERGPRLILLAAALSAVTSVIDKIGLLRTSPTIWAAALLSAIAIGLTPVVLSGRGRGLGSRHAWALAGVAGLLLAGSSLSLMLALEIGLAAYVIALKRMSGPLSVLIGRASFREGHFGRRLVGSAIIVAGVVLIAGG